MTTTDGGAPIDPSAVELTTNNRRHNHDSSTPLDRDNTIDAAEWDNGDCNDFVTRQHRRLPRRRGRRISTTQSQVTRSVRCKVGRSLTSCTREWNLEDGNNSHHRYHSSPPPQDDPSSVAIPLTSSSSSSSQTLSFFTFNPSWFTSRLKRLSTAESQSPPNLPPPTSDPNSFPSPLSSSSSSSQPWCSTPSSSIQQSNPSSIDRCSSLLSLQQSAAAPSYSPSSYHRPFPPIIQQPSSQQHFDDSSFPPHPIHQFRRSLIVAVPPSSSFADAHNNDNPNVLRTPSDDSLPPTPSATPTPLDESPSPSSRRHAIAFSPSLEFRWVKTSSHNSTKSKSARGSIEWESSVCDDNSNPQSARNGSIGTVQCLSRIDSTSSNDDSPNSEVLVSPPISLLSEDMSSPDSNHSDDYNDEPIVDDPPFAPSLSPASLALLAEDDDNDAIDSTTGNRSYRHPSSESDGLHSMSGGQPSENNTHHYSTSDIDDDEDDVVSELPTQFARNQSRAYGEPNTLSETKSISTRDLGTEFEAHEDSDYTEERKPSQFTDYSDGQHNQPYPSDERHHSSTGQLAGSQAQELNTSTPSLSPSAQQRESQRKPSHSSAGTLEESEIDEMALLKPETILCNLVHHKGQSIHIYLEKEETEHLDLEKMERFFLMFRRQYLSDATCIRCICRGRGAGIAMLVLGCLLIVLGIIPYFLGRSFQDKIIFYTSSDTNVSFSLDNNWQSGNKEVLVYFYIEDYWGCFRTTYSSRPKEFFPSYSCHSPGTIQDIASIRPLDTLPELNGANESIYFPCGLSSFSLFNDYVKLYAIDAQSKDARIVDWRTDDLAPYTSLITYSNLARPDHKTFEEDWIDVLSPRYRNWMEQPLGSTRRLLIARIPFGLPGGEYVLQFHQNVWPAELWSAKKAVAISRVSAIGSGQAVIGLFFCIWGVCMIFVGSIFLSLIKKRRWITQSASEVPEGRIEEVVSALCKQNDAVRKELFVRLQRRRLRGSRFSVTTGL